MVEAAKERGYAYITITDHSQSAAYAGGLQPQRVISQQEEIDRLNDAIDGIRIIKGIESDIRSDGSLDYDDAILKTFEVVIASVHSKLDMSEEEATARVVKAVENPYTTILGHPTGRLLLSREGFPLDYDKVFDACMANRVAVEINANCRRLDLDWRYVRKARDRGVMLSIGPDAHRIDGLDFMKYGVGIARKGWLEPGDVLNCLGVDEFLNWRS
jgi:DNA polymerase (family 10)